MKIFSFPIFYLSIVAAGMSFSPRALAQASSGDRYYIAPLKKELAKTTAQDLAARISLKKLAAVINNIVAGEKNILKIERDGTAAMLENRVGKVRETVAREQKLIAAQLQNFKRAKQFLSANHLETIVIEKNADAGEGSIADEHVIILDDRALYSTTEYLQNCKRLMVRNILASFDAHHRFDPLMQASLNRPIYELSDVIVGQRKARIESIKADVKKLNRDSEGGGG